MDGELFFDACKSEVAVSLDAVSKEDHKVDMMTMDSMPTSTTTTTSSPIRSSTTSTSTAGSVGY